MNPVYPLHIQIRLYILPFSTPHFDVSVDFAVEALSTACGSGSSAFDK